jgi:hypothetical protein
MEDGVRGQCRTRFLKLFKGGRFPARAGLASYNSESGARTRTGAPE